MHGKCGHPEGGRPPNEEPSKGPSEPQRGDLPLGVKDEENQPNRGAGRH